MHECLHKHSNQTFSVKSIKKQGFSYEEFKRQVMNEVYVLQNVRHQSLLKLNYIFEDDKKIHIITDLYTGGELISNKKGNLKLQLQEIKSILFKLLDAVRELHFKGFMHRDIKP